MLLRTLLAHYRRHPVQALFLLTGIIVANLLLVGTLLINAQARASYDRGETLLRASPIGQIRHRDPGRSFDERRYLALRLQGFDMVAPVLRRIVRATGGEPLELVGVDLFAMPRAGPEGPQDHPPQASATGFAGFAFPPYQLWAAPARIRQLGAEPGDRLPLDAGTSLPPLVAAPGEELGHRLLIDVGALQELTASAGELTAMLVFDAAPDRLHALESALPPELGYFPYTQAPDPAELTRSFHLNLAAMGLLAFVVGVFLIYNALAFSYTDRRELIRKLRLSGVTRGELRRVLLTELGLFLVVGGLLGGWLGAALAAWLLPGVGRTLAQLYGVYIAYPDGLTPSGLLLPLAMTLVAALLCVLFPLRESLQAPLLERWQAGWQLQAAARRDRLMLLAGLGLLLAAALISRHAATLWSALAGLSTLLIGAVLCLPTVLRLLLGGVERSLPRRRVRLAWLVADSRWLLGPGALALMALTLALVANSGLNTMIASFRQATDDWLQQRLAAQLYLRGGQELPGLAQWLQSLDPGLRTVDRYRTEADRGTPEGHSVRVEIVTLQPDERFLRGVRLLDGADAAQRRFAAGEGVFVSERAWRLDGWQVGQQLALCTGRPAVPVLGVYPDYGNPLSQWLLSERLFRACWPGLAPSGHAVFGPTELDWNAVRLALRDQYGLEADQLIDQAELKAAGLAVFDRTFAVTQALNALTLLVAGIGIFCAVSAIHHHRIGQQALLASLGMTRRERGALLLLQWALLGVLCMALVWPFGAALAAYLAGVVTPIAFGWSFPLRLEWAHYGVLAVLAAASLVLAVALPSLRLLRTSPAAMLREQAT
jgi:putative ABC transport system permease protein